MKKIKDLRIAMNITQQKLAEMLGVKQSTVGMWEIGARRPKTDLLIKLASVFNCSIDELLKA